MWKYCCKDVAYPELVTSPITYMIKVVLHLLLWITQSTCLTTRETATKSQVCRSSSRAINTNRQAVEQFSILSLFCTWQFWGCFFTNTSFWKPETLWIFIQHCILTGNTANTDLYLHLQTSPASLPHRGDPHHLRAFEQASKVKHFHLSLS